MEDSNSNERFQAIFNSLTKNEKKTVRAYVEDNGWEV